METGRPTIYTQELADRICELVASNVCGITRLCKMFPELPDKDTIMVWRFKKDGFSAQYNRAKQVQAEMMAESFEDVNDETSDFRYIDPDTGATKIDSGLVSQARLLIDTRKWTASKLAPKIYGDRKELEDVKADNERVRAELAELKAKLDLKNKAEY